MMYFFLLSFIIIILFFFVVDRGEGGTAHSILGPSVKVPAQQIAYVDADHGKG